MSKFRKKIWTYVSDSKHWESRMGWEYFLLLFIGSMLGAAFGGM
jgi:hypothetical protein